MKLRCFQRYSNTTCKTVIFSGNLMVVFLQQIGHDMGADANLFCLTKGVGSWWTISWDSFRQGEMKYYFLSVYLIATRININKMFVNFYVDAEQQISRFLPHKNALHDRNHKVTKIMITSVSHSTTPRNDTKKWSYTSCHGRAELLMMDKIPVGVRKSTLTL